VYNIIFILYLNSCDFLYSASAKRHNGFSSNGVCLFGFGLSKEICICNKSELEGSKLELRQLGIKCGCAMRVE
jgi:hypothetical protein